jgi:hypothetical protein
LKADKDNLLSLWLTDQIIEVIEAEKELASKALNVVRKYIRKQL